MKKKSPVSRYGPLLDKLHWWTVTGLIGSTVVLAGFAGFQAWWFLTQVRTEISENVIKRKEEFLKEPPPPAQASSNQDSELLKS